MTIERTKQSIGQHLLASIAVVLSLGAQAAPFDDEQVKRGEYLARAGDCVACHTLEGGELFAGGLRLSTPLGDVIATNITSSKTAGIGNYTLEQFDDAVRKGIRADGKYLYPAMPYTSYAKTTDEDIEAMYAYFMSGVAPVETRPPATELPFPFNIRLSMAVWNALFLDDEPYQPDPSQNAEWNRGAYLAQGLTHCSTCHSPRNFLMAEMSSKDLAGGEVSVWYAPNITSDVNSGIGGWSTEELVHYMKTGNIAKGQASGPMAEAIDHSLQYLTDADLHAIAVYLKTVPAVVQEGIEKPVYAWGSAVNAVHRSRSGAWPENPDEMTGAQLYDGYCAACHQAHGEGTFDTLLPALYQNTATGRPETNNLAMVILQGIHRVSEGHEIRMPGFAHELSDQQIATLSNYLIQTYGNPQAEVTVGQVENLRAGKTSAPDLVLFARVAMVVGVIVLLIVLIALMRRRRRRVTNHRY
ncbi:c-type cytochrome [Serpens gallinarum]|uniref:Cytochrome c n=1 Tax=Serpens gallinarum TaxID=2763075 RepID=A0ABR8TRL1_9PSED|nr:cytochrome c [Serpens gallinarum]MBD7978411.1 cytochrome c [Serpens gallinarum]